MIPKKINDLRPEKLRLILLMDARFNHNNKLIGKKMLEYGEKHNKLAEEQYGSRKNKSAIHHALNKRLILDHIRQFRIQAVYCANDARSCYDRILFMVAYLTLRIFGVPKEAARCSVDTICKMKHYVRTIFGDSKTYYGGEKWELEEGMLPHGNGQGNGNGPSLWSCISSPLLDILREEGFGIQFESPITSVPMKLSAIGFVDDMDYIQTQDPNHKDMQELFVKSQAGLQLWDELLRTTGGSLEIDANKTDCVAINFVPKNGLMYMTDVTFPTPLVARDTTGEHQPLTQLTVKDARKTLGVYQSPMGNEDAQFGYMLKQVLTWTSKIRTSAITRQDTLRAMATTIGRTMEYPLPATTLDEYQCNKIMSTFLNVALPKMGYARTTARNLVFAPSSMMGCGVPNLYVQQVIQHIQVLLDHGNQGSITGRLLNIVAEGTLIEAGCGGDLFKIDMSRTAWVTKTWITDTIHALQRYQLTLLHNLPTLTKWKEDDVFIMELIRDSNIFPLRELKWINEVRMHLQVITVSDITTQDGRQIKQNIYEGKWESSCSSCAYKWPHAAPPTKTSLRVWRESLRRIFNMQDNLVIDRSFIRTRWKHSSLKYFMWRMDLDTRTLYHKEEDGSFSVWTPQENPGSRQTRHQTSIFINTFTNVQDIPCLACPVDIIQNTRTSMRLMGKGVVESRRNIEMSNGVIDNDRDWSIRFLNLPEDKGESFALSVGECKGKAVCDGSFKEGAASSAFITMSGEETTGGNILPGSSTCQSSYRGELGGILGTIVFTKMICDTFGIANGSITIGCDCKGAIAAVKKGKWVTSRWNSYDIISRIQQELETTGIRVMLRYIKGHQDLCKAEEDLDDWEVANVKADALAKTYLQDYGHEFSRFLPQTHQMSMWTVCYDSQLLVSNIAKQIYSNIWRTTTINFWVQKLGILPHMVEAIDWDILSIVSKTLQEHKRQRYVKVMADIAPVGKILVRRGCEKSSHCPLCQCEEDNLHIWKCQHEQIQDIFSQGLQEVNRVLVNGPGFFSTYLRLVLMDLRIPTAINRNHETENRGCEHITSQMQLGAWATLWGVYHKDLVSSIEEFFHGTRRSGKIWLASVVIKLWEVYDEMWKLRNTIKHDKENSTDIRTHEILNQEIKDLFDKAPAQRFLMVSERRLFVKTQEQIKNQPIRSKKKWVRDATVVIKRFYDEAETSQEAQSFRQYFRTKRRKYGDNIQTMDMTKDGG